MNSDTLLFWAKTTDDKNNYDRRNAFHPLICHLIDVAVVTRKIWRDVLPEATKTRISQALGVRNAENLMAFIAGLHDLGKCSPPFTLRGKNDDYGKESLKNLILKHAGKESNYVGRLRGRLQTIEFLEIYKPTDFHVQDAVPKALCAPHGYVTTIELPEILVNQFGFNSKIAEQIGVLIGGHHGVFPNADWRKNGKYAIEENLGNHHWKNARIDLAGTLANLLQIKPLSNNETSKLDNGTIMILAGLVSVADWIGSDTQFFECAVDDFTVDDFALKQGSLEKYFEHAEQKAAEALKQLGWTFEQTKSSQSEEINLSNEEKFKKLFPFIETRRHLQDMAIEIAEELTSAGIAVIESPMGEGKTEAAMFLAETWNANLDQTGYYFALPTQATSNQMFGRVEDFLQKCFPNRNVHLQLTHGHASLSAEFETLKENHKRLLQDVFDENCNDCVPSVVAAEWFTYRKRALLAPFGVGTVDQALMAVLQTRHVFVRLFGLAHKTVIIDEVHAYDAYMSTLLERLLEWLAALGSPVILLSATLPVNRRNALIKAYQSGLGKVAKDDKPNVVGEDLYPRISYATDSTIKVRHINSSAKTQTLHIKKVVDENFVEELKAKLENKRGCIAIICNTVKRSQDIYEQLSKDDFFAANIDLLHSRFRFCDRDTIEKRVRLRFGKAGEKVRVIENGKEVEREVERPDFAVLVSTQIIEQSLDIDFDLMISDLAPVDLLLQRAGRLHRHNRKRPEEFKDATLWLIEPKIKDDGLPNFQNSIVYDEHILLRTWLILNELELIEIPTEIEKLIEAVYDKKRDCFDRNYQGFWDETKIKMAEKLKLKRAKAKTCRIMDSDDEDLFENDILNLDEDNPEIHKTLQALTRDDEIPNVSVVVLTHKEAKTTNLEAKPDKELAEFLLKRETKISKKGLTNSIIADEDLKQKSWKNSALLRHHRLLELDENSERTIGNFKISLSKNLGIVIEKTKR